VLDILLDKSGDIMIAPDGDISMTESVRQAVAVRLRWIFGEWRLGPNMGFPWFEEVFVKRPNEPKIRRRLRTEILKVEGVKAAKVTAFDYDPAKRTARIAYTCTVAEETYREELTLWLNMV